MGGQGGVNGGHTGDGGQCGGDGEGVGVGLHDVMTRRRSSGECGIARTHTVKTEDAAVMQVTFPEDGTAMREDMIVRSDVVER